LLPLEVGFGAVDIAASFIGLDRGGGKRDAVFIGETVFSFCTVEPSECFSNSSPIDIFLNATGILLTRISNRIRSPCACKAYWARSFRARSVTIMLVNTLASSGADDATDSPIVGCQLKPASVQQLCLHYALLDFLLDFAKVSRRFW